MFNGTLWLSSFFSLTCIVALGQARYQPMPVSSPRVLFSVEKVPFALQNGPIMPEESLICTKKK